MIKVTPREYIVAQITSDRELAQHLNRSTNPFDKRADAFEKLLKRYDRMERLLIALRSATRPDTDEHRAYSEALADD